MAFVRVVREGLRRCRHRPRRWLRRTRWVLAQTAQDLGMNLGAAGRPAWRWDNPFLTKTSRAELRRFSVGLRLLVAVLILSGLLLGGLWLHHTFPSALGQTLFFLLGMPFPTALFVIVSFVHAILVSNARTALAVSLGDEARRGTLPDLLMTPLRRAEMLIAMGVGPARTAFLVALVGLPIYFLLAGFGGLSAREIGLLYVLFALLSFAPASYALPALSGAVPATALPLRPAARRRQGTTAGPLSFRWLWPVLYVLFVSQLFGQFGGIWMAHLTAALHLGFGPLGRLMIIFAWPYYLTELLGGPLDIFGDSLPPLLFILPLIALNWAAAALESAAALGAEDEKERGALPISSRARTLARWTARIAAFLLLGVVWKAWVESGDTAGLAGGAPGAGGWDAAGLALILGGLTLPAVCTRALTSGTGRLRASAARRSPSLSLRRALKRAVRPLRVAAVTFLLACALGGLSPFAPPVYETVCRIIFAAGGSVLWAVGLRRVLPGTLTPIPLLLLYSLPLLALALPIPALWNLVALTPAASWVRLFPEGAALIQRFPLWSFGLLPPFSVCVAGTSVTGLLLMRLGPRAAQSRAVTSSRSAPVSRLSTAATARRRAPSRNAAQTAALMAWITRRTDNPLFTYEMRTRTRSGRWADWRFFVPAALFAAMLFALAEPDFVYRLSFLTPFHFIYPGFGMGGVASVDWASLAELLLAGQVYFIGCRGQTVGENLIARDRQRGIWGFILLTPLTSRQIFWGKVLGQTSGYAAIWVLLGLCNFLLYALSVPASGFGPAMIAWLTGQMFVAALFLLGVSLGAALATFPMFLKSLRGAATLLFVGLVGGGIYLNIQVFNFDQSDTWLLMATRLLLGSFYALGVSVPLLTFAEWRISDLRRRDIPFGDGAE